jgi:hypothetical protein
LEYVSKYSTCHAVSIFAVVGTAVASKCKDSFRMTTKMVKLASLREHYEVN